MMKKVIATLVGSVAGLALAGQTMAAVSAAEAAKLGAELTPLGGEKAGNADGSIPAWEGGITSAAQAGFPNFKPGEHHPDPYASEKPLYTVTAANMGQYANKLTEGHKKLLQTYRGTFKMNVYPIWKTRSSTSSMKASIWSSSGKYASIAESISACMTRSAPRCSSSGCRSTLSVTSLNAGSSPLWTVTR